jgi:uncharacterized membrane protein required for colicin V production
MNVLVVIILVVLLLSVLGGYKNGFLKTAFSLISWIIVLALCNVATPMVTEILIEKTDIEVVIQTTIDAELDKVISEMLEESAGTELQGVLTENVELEIPEELQAALPEELKQMLQKENFEVGDVAQKVVDTEVITERVVEILALLIVLVFSRIAIWIVYIVLDVASKLPLIGPLDKALGIVCGAAKGLVWIWVILIAVSMLALTGVNTEWVGYIAESELLTWLQDNNLILRLLIK